MANKDLSRDDVRVEGGKLYLNGFGEWRPISEWVLDARCAIRRPAVLRARLYNGWPAEQAITAAKNTKRAFA